MEILVKKYRVYMVQSHEMDLYAKDEDEAKEQAIKICKTLGTCSIDSIEEID
jgi:hypothetical protein